MHISNGENNTDLSTEAGTISNPFDKFIMIVDDEPDILNLFNDYLQMKGLKVRTFVDATQALLEIQNNLATIMIKI